MQDIRHGKKDRRHGKKDKRCSLQLYIQIYKMVVWGNHAPTPSKIELLEELQLCQSILLYTLYSSKKKRKGFIFFHLEVNDEIKHI